MRKPVIITVIVVLLCGVSGYLFKANLALKKSLKESSKAIEAEFEEKLKLKREKLKSDLKRDLEEKRRADIVSYRAMIKRLELEKEKAKEMEKKLEVLKRQIESR